MRHSKLNDVRVMKALARKVGARLDSRPEKGQLVDNWFMDVGDIEITVAMDQDGVLVESVFEDRPYDIVAQIDQTGPVTEQELEKALKKVISKTKKGRVSMSHDRISRKLLAVAKEMTAADIPQWYSEVMERLAGVRGVLRRVNSIDVSRDAKSAVDSHLNKIMDILDKELSR